VRFEAAATTDPGLRRPDNEDAYLLDTERGLFCVADGMGGHAAGEVASRLAVEALAREMARPDAGAPLDARLRAAVAAANRAILEAAGRDPTLVGMGTTLTALALATDDRSFTIAHIGDSRAYLYRQGALTQLTADHTWVQQQVDAGLLTPEEARRHPLASMLTRALGISDDPEVDIIHGELEPGDLILLCSDGLTGMVDDAELAAILARDDLPLDGLARELTAAANRNGGMDNITAILIRAEA
jgi:serine/threonine protein phosphatase PrpC